MNFKTVSQDLEPRLFHTKNWDAPPGWPAADLALQRKRDAGKVFWPARLRRETTMSLKWIANELRLGGWTYVAIWRVERNKNANREDTCRTVKRIAERLQMGTPGHANLPSNHQAASFLATS